MCLDYIKNTANQLEWKHITLAHAIYIFNVVVLPRILYLLQISEVSAHNALILQTPINKLIKIKGGFTVTIDNSVLHHKALIGLDSIIDKLIENCSDIVHRERLRKLFSHGWQIGSSRKKVFVRYIRKYVEAPNLNWAIYGDPPSKRGGSAKFLLLNFFL